MAEPELPLFVFRVCGVELAVPAKDVQIVSALDEPTPIPGAPSHIPGLVADGERVLPLLELSRFLDLDPDTEEVDPLFRRMILVRVGNLEAGLVCHRARGLISVPTSSLREPTVLQGARLRPFLASEVEDGSTVIGLLDLPGLLRSASIP